MGDRREVLWFKECKSKTFEELGSYGDKRFMPFDTLLLQGLTKDNAQGQGLNMPADLRRRITKLETEAMEKNSMLTGRQVVHMIYEWFRTDSHMVMVYNFTDLNTLAWKGDAKIHEFLDQWDHLIDNMDPLNSVSDITYRDILYKQLEKSAVLKEDMAHYRREPRDGKDKTYDFLRNSMVRHLDVEHQKKQRDAKHKEFTSGKEAQMNHCRTRLRPREVLRREKARVEAKEKVRGRTIKEVVQVPLPVRNLVR